MAYQLTEGDTILRLADRACIPPIEGNIEYIAYLEWLAEGNTPLPAPDAAVRPPQTPLDKLAAAGLTLDDLRALLASVADTPVDGGAS